VPEARAYGTAAYRARQQQEQASSTTSETFDHSMEVRLTRDGPPLSLDFNLHEEPEVAAARFLERHNLPVKYLAQFAGLVREQMTEVQFGSGGEFVDPLTGGGRYVPGGGSNEASGSGGTDPLTGGGRYVPGSALSNTNGTGSCPVDKKRPKSQHLPLRESFLFPLETVSEKAIAKLHEMNELQAESEIRLSEEELAALSEVMSKKEYFPSQENMSALEKSFHHWSIDTILPAMDCFRLAMLNKDVNAYFCSNVSAWCLWGY